MTWGTLWFLCAVHKLLRLAEPNLVALQARVAELVGGIPGADAVNGPALAIAYGAAAALVQGGLSALWLREIVRRPGREALFRPALANVLFLAVAVLACALLGRMDESLLSLMLIGMSLLTMAIERPAVAAADGANLAPGELAGHQAARS